MPDTPQTEGLGASAWLFQRFRVSFFKDAQAARIERATLDLPQLAEKIANTTAAEKRKLPWIKLAAFGAKRSDKGSLRTDANVQCVTGIEADYDGEVVTFETARATLQKAGVLALLYTSPSHTPEKPRWRVLCPLSGECPPDTRPTWMGRLNGLFNGLFALESWTLSQAYFYGHLDSGHHRVAIIDGEPIDTLATLDATWMGKPEALPDATGAGKVVPLRPNGRMDEAAMLEALATGASIHVACVRLGGKWSREGVPYVEARQRLQAAMEKASPEERASARWQERYADIDRSLADIYRKETAKQPAETAAEATGPQDAKADARPSLLVRAGRLDLLATQAEDALLASSIEVPIFQRGRELVRPVVQEVPAAKGRTTQAAGTALLTTPALIDCLSKAADWRKWDAREKVEVPATPPKIIAEIIQARVGHWQFPILAGVITTPTLRPDGTLLAEPGYDPATRLYVARDPTLTPVVVKEKPTRDDALAALALLEDLLDEFPFVRAVDRSVALSAILTAILRGSVTVAPLHALCASTAGTGKSYLADLISAICSGRECPVLSMSSKPEETESRLVGALLAGYPLINLDNVNGELGGDFLCQAVERPLVRVRRLGGSDMYEVESRATFLATGNGLRVRGDMTRRSVLCHLDANMERPETKQFARRPVEDVLNDRGRFVAAVLTIARAYIVAGMPGKLPALNSFEQWSDRVRSPLVWLGRADPVLSIEVAREDDPELSALTDVLFQWIAAAKPVGQIQTPGLTTRALIEFATQREKSQIGEPVESTWRFPHLRDALLSVAGVRGEINSNRLGNYLRGNVGRIAQGMRITKGKATAQGAITWGVLLDRPYERPIGAKLHPSDEEDLPY